jgi:hypothetical protein
MPRDTWGTPPPDDRPSSLDERRLGLTVDDRALAREWWASMRERIRARTEALAHAT